MGKALITDYITTPDVEAAVLGDRVTLTPSEDVEVLLVWHERIDDAYLQRFPRLKGVVRYGVGYEMLDLQALRARGVIACNTPDYGTEEVADTTIAMILALTRGLTRYDAVCRGIEDGSWQENVLSPVRRSSSLTVGVIGAGRIGGSVLLRARSLRFRTSFYDPYVPSGHEKTLGACRVDTLAELIAGCEIISCHAPLTETTRGLVDERFVNGMCEGAIFVNTARGPIVTELDVFYEALKSGRLFGVALDVLPQEPPQSGRLLRAWRDREAWLDGRMFINPHTAFYSVESFEEMRRKAALNALLILNGQPARNEISPHAFMNN